MSRVVLLLELTCCAEEGVKAAQLRKQTRYHELVENINSSKWNATLLTIEVGARGLIGNGTFRAFVKLGFPPQTATTLCRALSVLGALFVCDLSGSQRRVWAFLVHDFCLTFATELEEMATKRLKAWSGLYRSADVGALYRQREHLGLQLTSLSFHYKHMQIVKACLLSTSQDHSFKKSFIEHNLRFAGQTDHKGSP